MQIFQKNKSIQVTPQTNDIEAKYLKTFVWER